MLTSRVLQPGLRAMGVWTQFQSVRLAIKKVNELFSMPLESNGNYKCEKAVGGRIDIQDVSFKYPGQEESVLRNASLVIEPGETIGLTGNNGAGKSTLISLLSGFLQPDSGSISIDGHPPG